MNRKPRDRRSEKAAIAAAAERLLAGTPLRSSTGKLSATELIIESGLRRDVVYEHNSTDRVVETFVARAKAQSQQPAATGHLASENQRLERELAEAKNELAAERAAIKTLTRVVTELSLELEQSREELAAGHQVSRLPVRRRDQEQLRP